VEARRKFIEDNALKSSTGYIRKNAIHDFRGAEFLQAYQLA